MAGCTGRRLARDPQKSHLGWFCRRLLADPALSAPWARRGRDRVAAPTRTRQDPKPRSGRPRDLSIALIAARILDPGSKLATARALHPDTLSSSLSGYLGLEGVTEDELYRAMDWLLERQSAIEATLAKRHLSEGGLVYTI